MANATATTMPDYTEAEVADVAGVLATRLADCHRTMALPSFRFWKTEDRAECEAEAAQLGWMLADLADRYGPAVTGSPAALARRR